jgi:hypothetical protein
MAEWLAYYIWGERFLRQPALNQEGVDFFGRVKKSNRKEYAPAGGELFQKTIRNNSYLAGESGEVCGC